MPLSDDEIRYLSQKAELYKNAIDDDLSCLKQSLDCYNRLIDDFPSRPYYFKERAEVKCRLYFRLLEVDQITEAINDISEAVRLDPDNGEHYIYRGAYILAKIDSEKKFSDQTRLKAVVSDYKSALSRVPTNFVAWHYLIAVSIICGDYDEAVSLYGQCKPYVDSKESALFRAYLGCLALVLAGEEPEEDDFSLLYDNSVRLLKFDPCEGYVASFVGGLCTKVGDGAEGDKLPDILNLLIGHYRRWEVRAFLLEKLGLYQKTLEAYEEAVKQEPDYALSWYNQGRLLVHFGRYEEALESYDEALKLKADFAPALINRGNLLKKLGHDY